MSLLAAADSASGSSGGSALLLLLPLALLAFLFISQRRRTRKVAQVQADLSVGDEIMTSAGLMGSIARLEERIVHLEISPGVVVRLDRRAVLGPQALPSGGATGDGPTPDGTQ